MKLKRASIRNFKLLRNIELQFSTQKELPLTVIRAENGSGKTSSLLALKWGLYGRKKLSDPSVRLSPADWPDGDQCAISVTIEFIHTHVSQESGSMLSVEEEYVLTREVNETPKGDFPNRSPEEVYLYRKTTSGTERIDEIELSRMLPEPMVDIFFTNGDAAMTFISPQLPESTKQEKVRSAIREMLGLEKLEDVARRLKSVRGNVNREIGSATSSEELAFVTKELERMEGRREELASSLADLEAGISKTEQDLGETERRLHSALEAGNYKDLSLRKQQRCRDMAKVLQETEECKKQQQALLQSKTMAWGLIGESLQRGYNRLRELRQKGVIPRAAVPILQERLEMRECICGADLSPGTPAHSQVESMLAVQRTKDQHVELLSTLYFQAQNEVQESRTPEDGGWKLESRKLRQVRVSIEDRKRGLDNELKSIDGKLSDIDENLVQELIAHQSMLRKTQEKHRDDRFRTSSQLEGLGEKIGQLEKKLEALRRKDDKVRKLNLQMRALEDLTGIVHGTLGEMQNVYLGRVSKRMEAMFMNVIGADPEQGSIYQGAKITSEYDIVVESVDGRTLSPDSEVNGASQRALTFAFIWALTEVSGVVAPRIIDTPLGMMSGGVKERVLEMVSKPARLDVDRQVVLFLTQSEIAQTEEILDSRVGASMTLTKTDDFPTDLVYDPRASRSEVRVCECSHRQCCSCCQRHSSQSFNLRFRD